MRILGRIVLFLLVLALLAGLLAVVGILTPVPWLSAMVQRAYQAMPWLTMALAGVVLLFAALCVLALVLLATVPTRRRYFVVKRELGDIEITKQSIESAASAALSGLSGLKRFHVQVKGSPGPHRVHLDVDAEPAEGESLAAMGDEVQTSLAETLRCSLAVDPKRVRVRVVPVPPGHVEGGHARVPRVV